MKSLPIEAVTKLVDELVTSKEERLQLLQKANEMQVDVNNTEAQHSSIFVAGWRPFIGWVCGVSLGCYFIPKHIMASVIWVMAINNNGFSSLPPYPIEATAIMELVLGMLGLSAMRTYERQKGVSRNFISKIFGKKKE